MTPDVYTASWAAGLFDGEGCVNLGWQTTGGIRRRLTLEMNHEKTVNAFAHIVGVGVVRPTKHGTFVWQVVSRQAETVARLLHPLSITKKEDLSRFLALSDLVNSRPLGRRTPPELREKYVTLIAENRK